MCLAFCTKNTPGLAAAQGSQPGAFLSARGSRITPLQSRPRCPTAAKASMHVMPLSRGLSVSSSFLRTLCGHLLVRHSQLGQSWPSQFCPSHHCRSERRVRTVRINMSYDCLDSVSMKVLAQRQTYSAVKADYPHVPSQTVQDRPR